MDKKICEKIIENKEMFIPHLFTAKQVEIMERYLNNLDRKGLSRTEKAYLYSTIKKKVDALMVLKDEYHIRGEDMIKDRVKEAKEILKNVKKETGKEKAFISGTFLFAEEYNDIDIYIISEKRKQYHKDKLHYIFITEEDLKKPIFNSALQYCVANFFVEVPKPEIKRPEFSDLIMTYEMAVNEIIDNDDQKMIREILFEYYMQIKKIILDSYSLYKEFKVVLELKQEKKIDIINKITRELLLNLYSNSYLYNELAPFVKRIKGDIPNYKVNENLIIYVEMLDEVKNECRRVKT